MGGILATHLAQNRPEGVHGLLLFAPTLKLDGWSMPWYSRVLQLPPAAADQVRVRPGRARALRPEGRARARPRRLGHAERRCRPGRRVQHAAALVRQSQRAGVGGEARPRQGVPARPHRPPARGRHGEPARTPTTCRSIWAGWSTRWSSTTAITWSRWTSSATSWPSGPRASWNGCRARFAPGARWRVSPRVSRGRMTAFGASAAGPSVRICRVCCLVNAAMRRAALLRPPNGGENGSSSIA